MPRYAGLLPGKLSDVLDPLAVADWELAMAERLLQAAYRRTVGGKVRTLRRQAKGLQG